MRVVVFNLVTDVILKDRTVKNAELVPTLRSEIGTKVDLKGNSGYFFDKVGDDLARVLLAYMTLVARLKLSHNVIYRVYRTVYRICVGICRNEFSSVIVEHGYDNRAFTLGNKGIERYVLRAMLLEE